MAKSKKERRGDLDANVQPLIVRPPIAAHITGYAESTMWERIAAGKFPKPVPLGPKARGFMMDELREHAETRRAERDGTDEAT